MAAVTSHRQLSDWKQCQFPVLRSGSQTFWDGLVGLRDNLFPCLLQLPEPTRILCPWSPSSIFKASGAASPNRSLCPSVPWSHGCLCLESHPLCLPLMKTLMIIPSPPSYYRMISPQGPLLTSAKSFWPPKGTYPQASGMRASLGSLSGLTKSQGLCAPTDLDFTVA